MLNNLFEKGFAQLLEESALIEATNGKNPGGVKGYVDGNMLLGWKVKVKNLIAKACGTDSEHYRQFEASERALPGNTNLTLFLRFKAILNATKEDFEGGYLVSQRELIQAEVFESELEQAAELLAKGYSQAAAVIAGCVLETGLQALGQQYDVPRGKIEAMNAALVKAGAYNVLRQKQITAWADLRNKAAHGLVDQFSHSDVETMIAEVQRILS